MCLISLCLSIAKSILFVCLWLSLKTKNFIFSQNTVTKNIFIKGDYKVITFEEAKELVEQAEQNPTAEIIAEAEEAILLRNSKILEEII